MGKVLTRPLSAGELLPAAALGAQPAATTVTVPFATDAAPQLHRGQRIVVWLSTASCPNVVLLPDVVVQDVHADAGTFAGSGTGQDAVVTVSPALAARVVAALAIDKAAIRAGVLTGAPADPARAARPDRVHRLDSAVKLPVLVAAGGAEWETRVLAALEQPASQLSVARRCVDVVDLLAVAASGQGRVALVAAGLRRLDADAVDRLIAAEVTPVAVVRRGDQAAEDRMRALGIEHVVPDDADVSVVVAVVREAVTRRSEPPTRTAPRLRRSGDVDGAPAGRRDTGRHRSSPPATVRSSRCGGRPERRDVPPSRSRSPTNSPASDAHALLVDADVYGGTVAADARPAGRVARAGRRVPAGGGDPAGRRGAGRGVLAAQPRACASSPGCRSRRAGPSCGRPRSRRCSRPPGCWPTSPCSTAGSASRPTRRSPSTRSRRGATARRSPYWTPPTSSWWSAPRIRSGCSVWSAGWPSCGTPRSSAPVRVVLNKVRRGAVPGDPAAELAAALEQFAGRSAAALLPYDRESLDAAWRPAARWASAAGQPVAQGRGGTGGEPVRTVRSRRAARRR